jgi:CitMHS family citrate-Mg2+:H+ or citrate-Ca2+:H+ symporter
MTLTGVRGLLAITFITLPAYLVIGSLFFFLPITESVLMYGAAAVFGVPLVLLFNAMGMNPIVALAGMSVIWPLGDAPPNGDHRQTHRRCGRCSEKYGHFLKKCIVPAIVISIIGTLMVIYSKQLGFLTGIN